MNLFGCCKSVQNGTAYQITSRQQNKKSAVTFVKSYEKIGKDVLGSSNASVLKLNRSDYDTIAKEFGKKDKKWTDGSFHPNDQSLGVIENITSNKWIRISDIVQNAVIFNYPVNPSHVHQQQHPDKAFLASVASLAERPERIQAIFGHQVYNPNGFYKVLLRVNAEVQQILIDDYVPVNEDGSPLFAKPHENEIWVMLLEKARAKVYGSYQNLFAASSTPKEILEQIAFAPTQRFAIPQVNQQPETSKIWKQIHQNSQKDRPIITKSGSKVDIDWKTINLLPNHFYSLINSAVLRNTLGKEERIVKLRNASGLAEWKGTANESDKVFWDQVQQTQAKERFLATEQNRKDGVFYILFSDFVKYFTEMYVCYHETHGSYINENLFFNLKNGLVHELQIYQEGFHAFSVDQKLQSLEDEPARTTLLLIRKYNQQQGPTEYEFLDGHLSVDHSTSLIKGYFTPGTYLLYTKVRPTSDKGNFPKNPELIIYSERSVKIHLATQQANPDFLKKTFLSYGRSHKRQLFNDDLMWTSWKLFNQGGYGFMAFGNDKDSREKFVITFNEEDFTNQGFTMKKPFKGKGANQVLEVAPGEQAIILVTVGNSVNKNRKFPPKIGVNIHPLYGEQPVLNGSNASQKGVQEEKPQNI